MEFTFYEYEKILKCIKKCDYSFANYTNWTEFDKSVILRHDVDISLKKAYEMAQFENSQGVSSTYFVLVTGDFYNTFNKRNIKLVRAIAELGMDIGLHFDETIYPENCDLVAKMEQEIHVMELMFDMKIKSVSMHVPSKKTLEANYVIAQGKVINSYSDVFFKEFKYVSDSKMNWRENVYNVIESGEFSKIHLLTHPIWYNDRHISMWDTVAKVLSIQAEESYKDFEVHTVGVEGKKTVKECLEAIND